MADDRLGAQVENNNRAAEVTPTEDRPPPTMLESMTARVGPSVMQRKLSERVTQRKAEQGGDAGDAGDIHATAQAGVSGGGGPLPHMDAIQRSFGHHQVANVQAHSGGAAGEASRAMGAQAYATGNSVAFDGSPDLHTAAHEAAHVVQQRAGVSVQHGVGKSGDKYENHADAVADKVVHGESAEALLDDMVKGGGGGGGAVQHKNTIVDDPKDKKNSKSPGQGRGVLQEEGGTVNTRITFGGLQDGCATTMTAVLKPKGDDMDGTTVDAWPPWWAASAPTSGSYWVQGHLLNMKLGGPGEARNLTPITKKANSRHLRFIEQYAKAAAANGDSIEYTVTAQYDGTGPHLTKDATNPKPNVWGKICRGFDCMLTILDKKTGKAKDAPHPLGVINER